MPEAPEKRHVLEIKTHSKKSFDALVKDGVEKSKPQHFVQMQVYMAAFDVDRALYYAVCKDDDRIYTERIEYDPKFADGLRDKAHRIIAMLGLEQLSPDDRKVVARARRLERFLTQPFFTTEQFTGLKGKLVSLKDALDGCERILADEFKDLPESALYMIGAVDEATAKAKATAKPSAQPESAPQPVDEEAHAVDDA